MEMVSLLRAQIAIEECENTPQDQLDEVPVKIAIIRVDDLRELCETVERYLAIRD